MPKIAIGTDILNDITKALQKEWITANGLGGYASSTVIGCNTRRYHGLLVSSGWKEKERMVLLSKLEETIKIGHKYYYLGTNRYTDNYIHPHGYRHIRKFEQAPFPRMIFTIDDITVTKEIFMPYGRNTTVIRYNVFGGNRDFNFILNPLFAIKDFHELQKENRVFDTGQVFSDSTLCLSPYPDLPAVRLKMPGMAFKELKNWYKNFTLLKEEERGLNYTEDLYNPGYFYTGEVKNFKIDVVVTTEEEIQEDIDALYKDALERVEELFETAEVSHDDTDEKSLVLAADLHIVKPPGAADETRTTIVAGYPWFGDWGRDTFISLPGITLCAGRLQEARDILLAFSHQCKDGLIPNRFADLGREASYNTVDASLWYINAAYEYTRYTGDYDFIGKNIYSTCQSIMEFYEKGTLYGIKMDGDGLINAGEEGYQLTWMDAKVGDKVITARMGKPVEISALWYNALRIMGELAEQFKDKKAAEKYRAMAETTRKSFNEKFWNEQGGCLYDVITENGKDDSFRPNQVFAISLPFPVLAEEKWAQVISRVHEKLYTPFGLRSLSPDSVSYHGKYSGSLEDRDEAYHQGVAWGFLLGPFLEAYMKAGKYSPEALERADTLMNLWMGDLTNGGQNTLSEIIDGDEPFTTRGCISQAWSIGEALRLKKIINTLLSRGRENSLKRMDKVFEFCMSLPT